MMDSGENKPRRSFVLAIFLAIAGLGISIYNTLTSIVPAYVYELNELGYSRVLQLFEDGVKEVIVMHDWGTDTLRSMEAYILLRDRISQIQADEGVRPVLNEGSPERKIDNVPYPILRLDIAGDRKKGQELYFTIEDYDPRMVYYLDYGEGQTYRVEKVSSFTYDEPGWYKVSLMVSGNGSTLKYSYSKTIRISGLEEARPSWGGYTRPSDPPKINSYADLEIIDGKTWIVADSSELPTSSQHLELTDLGGASNFPEDTVNQVEVEIISPSETQAGKPHSPIKVNRKDAELSAEIMPKFPGGTEAMQRYFEKNAKYPPKARDRGIEGTVLVRVVIQPNGELTDLKVIKGIGYDCDKEALRLISKMPRWIPGEQDGAKVPVYKVLPVQFRLIE